MKIADPSQALVYWTRRHPRQGSPVDPTDAAALQERREGALMTGGTYAECSWGFLHKPARAPPHRMLIRTRATSPENTQILTTGFREA